ncbi:hypothetical protein [uncultured Dialister sp.]|uniref:hypothetical protein n=1 Tax=uncultured Dialister sp. TaxID=278064 RepID=UPI00267059A1|nr:hypothetical protein [uncultured Dialister sp.]
MKMKKMLAILAALALAALASLALLARLAIHAIPTVIHLCCIGRKRSDGGPKLLDMLWHNLRALSIVRRKGCLLDNPILIRHGNHLPIFLHIFGK